MDRSKAESLIASEAEGWELAENEQKHLKIQRTFRTKNFVKALELCNRFGEVAEAEGHHPDLHITVKDESTNAVVILIIGLKPEGAPGTCVH
ncbi:hypothetical protein WJX75_006181 [Coccomyxa subellipsoidea]|uniref:4a-hydroxytetrahydrobiopterin dehydratase n=1 Tax=Coccomyxa subellipsoidea TaxID=248742 RepID=A0ABR2YE08_9CHLO